MVVAGDSLAPGAESPSRVRSLIYAACRTIARRFDARAPSFDTLVGIRRAFRASFALWSRRARATNDAKIRRERALALSPLPIGWRTHAAGTAIFKMCSPGRGIAKPRLVISMR